jgi:long-chain acyl-CoA synthetase
MKHPWLKNYPPGMPHAVNVPKQKNLAEFFSEQHSLHGDNIAFENMGVTLTYREMEAHSNAFAAYLQNLGLRPGDRIAIQLPNILQFPVAFIGACKAGLIIVPTNPLYTPREMEHQFNDSGVTAIVILSNFAHNLEKIIIKTSIKHVIVTRIGDLLGTVKGMLINFVVKTVKKSEPTYCLPGSRRFMQALKVGKQLKRAKVEASHEDIAVLQYTGGTTGLSKGAQLSHGNILYHASQISTWLQPGFKGNHEDVVICPLPLYHIYALGVALMIGYGLGCKIVLITNPRDISAFVKELKKHKFSIFAGVNTLFNALIRHPRINEVDFSSLRIVGAGAMALQDSVAQRWKELTGVAILQGYGLSENSGALSSNPVSGKNKNDTVGLPIPSTELGIFDESGRQLPQGDVGEICARGPQVMRGYWNMDNKKVFFEGGWFRTGDMGFMDEDGYFKMVDRKKDMINVSGLKVFPNEIENVVAGHPKILECAALGIPDPHCGEAVQLFVVKKDGSLTEDEVMKFCRENFAKYKVPKRIEFIDAIPKTPVGKILRRVLRENEKEIG